jgi:RNA polymerase sigma-54 factor
MKTHLNVRTAQNMVLTPQLLQSIRLLQLSALELEQEVDQALEDNVESRRPTTTRSTGPRGLLRRRHRMRAWRRSSSCA